MTSDASNKILKQNIFYTRDSLSHIARNLIFARRDLLSAKRLVEFNKRACFLKSCQIVVESVNEERRKVARQEYVPVTRFLPLLLRTRAHS